MNKYEQHLQHNIIELHCQLKLSTINDTGRLQSSLSINSLGTVAYTTRNKRLDGRTFDISGICSLRFGIIVAIRCCLFINAQDVLISCGRDYKNLKEFTVRYSLRGRGRLGLSPFRSLRSETFGRFLSSHFACRTLVVHCVQDLNEFQVTFFRSDSGTATTPQELDVKFGTKGVR